MVAAKEVVVRPEVTVRARNQAEVECLLSASGRMGIAAWGRTAFKLKLAARRHVKF